MTAVQITFTEDVNRIAAAANADASIRWYAYERDVDGVTGIYVQRKVSGVLQAEVRFIRDGSRPAIFFNEASSQWYFFYEFNEQTWLIIIDENDAPVTQISQQGTLIVHLRTAALFDPKTGTTAQLEAELTDSIPSPDVYASPLPPEEVAAASSPNAGFFRIRWLVPAGTDLNFVNQNVYGFNLFIRRYDTGQIYKLNPSIIPFVAPDPFIYEYEVPAVPGAYIVQQVDSAGLRLDLGRLSSPRDEVPSDGTKLPRIIEAFMGAKLGAGYSPDDLRFSVTDFITRRALVLDTFPSHLGAGDLGKFTVVDFTPTHTLVNDSFTSHIGQGITSRLVLTGFTPIVVG